MKLLLFVSLLTVTGGAQVLPDQYIVELSADPIATHAARQNKGSRRFDPELAAHRAQIGAQQGRVIRNIASAEVQVLDSFQTVHNSLVVRMSRDKAASVAALPDVRSVRPVRMYQKLLDRSLALQKVTDAWQQVGVVDKAGMGVKIAILDTGIDISHPAFQDSGLSMPEGFPKVNRSGDTTYTNSKVIVARAYTNPKTNKTYSAQDIDGHGTGVAMIAGGVTNTGVHGPITGVAPRAWLGNYKVFPDNAGGAPDSVIIRALEDAVNDGMDVINLSLGGFPATRPADDSLAMAVENAAAAGKLVVVAAGNEGSAPNTIGSPGTAPSAISVGSTFNDRIFAGHVIADGKEPYTAIPGSGKNSETPISGPVKDVTALDPTALACDGFPAGSLSGSIALISRGTCTFTVKLQNAQSAGAIAAIIYARATSPDPISMSTTGADLPAVMVSNADGNTLRDAANNPPADAPLSVSVDFSPTAALINPLHLSGFSSVGPNSDAGIKPDLVGVGQSIYTARPVSLGSYVVESGTSFSAPTVAGAAALLVAARPGLTAKQYRSLLINSTTPFSLDGSQNPLGVQSEGSGLLNMAASLSNSTTVSPSSLSFGIGGGTINWAQKLTVTNVGSTPDNFAISAQPVGDGPIPSLSTTTLQLAPGQSAELAVQLVAQALTGGAYQGFLRIQGTQSAVTGRVPYWYAVPTQSAQYLQILNSPTKPVRHDAMFDVEFRALDANGVPVTDGIDASIVSGAKVVSIESSDADIPGSFVAHIQAPAERGPLSLQFSLGAASAPVSVTIN